jgi:hypothetical protein
VEEIKESSKKKNKNEDMGKIWNRKMDVDMQSIEICANLDEVEIHSQIGSRGVVEWW